MLGVTSLLLTVAGYWAGRYGETTGRDRSHAPLLAVAVVTVLYAVAALVLHFVLGHEVGSAASSARASCGAWRWNVLLTVPGLRALPPRARPAAVDRARARGAAPCLSSARPSRRFLPPDPRVAQPYRLTPGLALRIGILGTIVLAVFAVLFLRLWALQVLSGDRYLNAAQNNQLRTIRVQAPRGPILDRNGLVVVDNAAGNSVQLWPADLPDDEAERDAVLRRLAQRRRRAGARGWSARSRSAASDPLTPIVVKRGVHEDHVFYIAERPEQFPGVQVATSFLRRYPYKALGAQMLGHVGEVSAEQLDASDDPGLAPGDEVGQAGVESVYDEFLRGRTGSQRLRVDSLGRPLGERVARPGGPAGLRAPPHRRRPPPAGGRARAAVRDPAGARDGRVVRERRRGRRHGPAQRRDPRARVQPHLQAERLRRPRRAAEARGRRADQGDGAAEELPGAQPRARRRLPAGLDVEAGDGARGDGGAPAHAVLDPAVHAELHLRRRERRRLPVRQLDDRVRHRDDAAAGARGLVQHVLLRGRAPVLRPAARARPPVPELGARASASARPTGIELGGEATGLLPTPEWRKRTYAKSRPDRPLWKPGDSIQLAIGQKDLLVTPLQMARFYALVANGGKLVTPRIAIQAERPGQPGGVPEPVQRFTAPVPQPVNVDAAALDVVREGLYLATHGVNGTATGVFGELSDQDRRQDRHGAEGRRTASSATSRGGAASRRTTTRRSPSAR